ncbi:MAG TPA: alpha/beta hydrolase [Sphingomonas sp.]|jgi:pimeloyl-ACP methyl ester carboxylesterase
MAGFSHLHWTSEDGLRLHARDYPGGADRVPVVCLHGLTRNARDYDELAMRLAGRRRVLAVDFRGRGESQHARDPSTYVPATYARDLEAMLAATGIERFVAVGTSLGGIVTMLLAQRLPGRIAAALINDVGPEIEAAGLARIRSYVGRASSLPTWMHAARCLSENNRAVYPDWRIEDWLAMAKRVYRLSSAGRVVLDYDLKIAEPFRVPGGETGPDMWSALDGLSGVPVLIVRGARSDVLSDAVARRMAAALPDAELVTVAGVGHAPTLGEPDLADPIERLLARADGG